MDNTAYLEAPEGWHKHLKPASDFFFMSDSQMYINQIKEKFGHLRWYADNVTDKEQTIINYIQWLCGRTCTDCGSMESVVTENMHGWIYTLCNKCMTEKKEKYFCIDEKNNGDNSKDT